MHIKNKKIMHVGRLKCLITGMLCILMIGCHRTAPQSPSRRSGKANPTDTTILSLMEVNRLMANQADGEILEIVKQWEKKNKMEFAQLNCGAWKNRRDEATRERSYHQEIPFFEEEWQIRFQAYNLTDQLLIDTEGVYKINHCELPIAVEEAIANMFAGEEVTVIAPWYCAYGIHGKNSVKGYENIVFKITLIERKN